VKKKTKKENEDVENNIEEEEEEEEEENKMRDYPGIFARTRELPGDARARGDGFEGVSKFFGGGE
jgi:hypothetical protein